MDKYLSIQDIVNFFETVPKIKLNRVSILRYIRTGAACSSLTKINKDEKDRKKYYHPLVILEALTAYHLHRGEIVNIHNGPFNDYTEVICFGTGHLVNSDIFVGRTAYYASEGTIDKLQEYFSFCDYPIKDLRYNLYYPAEGESWEEMKKRLLPTIEEHRKRFHNFFIPVNLQIYKKVCGVHQTHFRSEILLKNTEYCYLGAEDTAIGDTNSAKEETISLNELNKSNKANLDNIFYNADLTDSYMDYQQKIYRTTFESLLKCYLPLIWAYKGCKFNMPWPSICNPFFDSEDPEWVKCCYDLPKDD